MIRHRQMPWPALLVIAALLVVGCGRDEAGSESVVLYVSADEHIARQVVRAFEEATGIDVKMVGDTEAKKNTGLVQRLLAERDNPQADVFWSSEIFLTVTLARQEVLAPHDSRVVRGWPATYRDSDRRWYAFAARPRVLVYRPDRLAPDDLPESWIDLTSPEWRGRIVMADPRFGTTGGHLGAMKAYWEEIHSPAYYRAFLEELARNEVRLLPSGNAGVVQVVADGEADLGFTDADDVWSAQARGLNIACVYPRHHPDPAVTGAGTLLIPNTAGVVAGGPNPHAAARLVDFLLSEQVERLLAESVSHNMPLRPGLANEYPEYVVPDPLVIDYERAAAHRALAVNLAMHRLGGRDEADAP